MVTACSMWRILLLCCLLHIRQTSAGESTPGRMNHNSRSHKRSNFYSIKTETLTSTELQSRIDYHRRYTSHYCEQWRLFHYSLTRHVPGQWPSTFRAQTFLELLRNKRLLVIGDTVGRQLFEGINSNLHRERYQIKINDFVGSDIDEIRAKNKEKLRTRKLKILENQQQQQQLTQLYWYSDYNATVIFCLTAYIGIYDECTADMYLSGNDFIIIAIGSLYDPITATALLGPVSVDNNYSYSDHKRRSDYAPYANIPLVSKISIVESSKSPTSFESSIRQLRHRIKEQQAQQQHELTVLWRLHPHAEELQEEESLLSTTFWAKRRGRNNNRTSTSSEQRERRQTVDTRRDAMWMHQMNNNIMNVAKQYDDLVLDWWKLSGALLKSRDHRHQQQQQHQLQQEEEEQQQDGNIVAALHADAVHFCSEFLPRLSAVLVQDALLFKSDQDIEKLVNSYSSTQQFEYDRVHHAPGSQTTARFEFRFNSTVMEDKEYEKMHRYFEENTSYNCYSRWQAESRVYVQTKSRISGSSTPSSSSSSSSTATSHRNGSKVYDKSREGVLQDSTKHALLKDSISVEHTFDDEKLLSFLRNKQLAVIGDSLGLQLYHGIHGSLYKHASRSEHTATNGSVTSASGSDFGFHRSDGPFASIVKYLEYNATILYCNSPLLDALWQPPYSPLDMYHFCGKLTMSSDYVVIAWGAWKKPLKYAQDHNVTYKESAARMARQVYRISALARRAISFHNPCVQVLWRLGPHVANIDEQFYAKWAVSNKNNKSFSFEDSGVETHGNGKHWSNVSLAANWPQEHNNIFTAIAKRYPQDVLLDWWELSLSTIEYYNSVRDGRVRGEVQDRKVPIQRKGAFLAVAPTSAVVKVEDHRVEEIADIDAHADSLHYCAQGVPRLAALMLQIAIEEAVARAPNTC